MNKVSFFLDSFVLQAGIYIFLQIILRTADTVNRNNLTLRISFDEGLTWNKKILVDGSDIKPKDYSAYSDMVVINSKDIGVLYEHDIKKPLSLKLSVGEINSGILSKTPNKVTSL
ncbi:MAG: sialidase family protein [Ginsengibacter sp.]